MHTVLEVRDLQISFARYMRGLRREHMQVTSGINLTVKTGQITAVIGSSGSGKSLLAQAILGILPEHAQMKGTMLYYGEPLDAAKQRASRGTEIVYVPQAVSNLDPLMRAAVQVRTAVKGSRQEAKARQREVFRRYRLPERTERLYPHELSGGMARRVLIAAAAVVDAKLVIADEPTPGLPRAEVQEALQHLRELANQGSGVLLITHDIESALTVADQIVVFYAGMTVEIASVRDFDDDAAGLRHPYSRALWRALPQHGFQSLAGIQPQPGELTSGCPFAPRCELASERCASTIPELREVRNGYVRCIHAE